MTLGWWALAGDHLGQGTCMGFGEGRACEVPVVLLPAQSLFPDQQAQLVTQVEEALVLRVVRAAYEGAPEVAQQLQVGNHLGQRQRRTELWMGLVPAVAQQPDRLVVDGDAAGSRGHPAQAYRYVPVVIAVLDPELVQVRLVRRPRAG